MEDLKGKVKYLQGLAEGLNLSEKSDEGKVLTQMLDVLNGMAEEIDTYNSRLEKLEGLSDLISEQNNMLLDDILDLETAFDLLIGDIDIDLADLPFDIEDLFYDEDDLDDIEDVELEDDIYEVNCPNCNNIYFAEFDDFDQDNVFCPHCGTHYHLNERIVDKLLDGQNDHQGEE